MYQLIYVSYLSDGYDADEVIASIKSVAKTKNKKFNVTGRLLYSHNTFIQLLEGDKVNVDVTYAIIKNDPRHFRSTIIFEQECDERAYPEWSMDFRPAHKIDMHVVNKILQVNESLTKKKTLIKE